VPLAEMEIACIGDGSGEGILRRASVEAKGTFSKMLRAGGAARDQYATLHNSCLEKGPESIPRSL
jgi:hypothetical protein